jgi:hypothetical protein
MMTETQSLDDMLDDTVTGDDTAPAVQELVVETGDKHSAAPPADADPAIREDAPHVPRKALEDERRKRQDLERQLAEYTKATQPAPQQQRPQPQQHQQPVITQEDLERLWWENPVQAAAIVQELAVQRASQEADNRMISWHLNRSEKKAVKAHGDEIVTAAVNEAIRLGKNREFFEEDDPYQALVDWYKDIEVARNPQSMRDQIRAELMAEMGLPSPGSAPAQKTKAPVPRSLASAANARPRDDRGRYESPTSLEDILG